ncbi:DUF5011 domain-containing protein, partial [Candidatus Kaiserbacteria bacterium]|nr:DUF5011 domain-containing protein [Candidatus Kaiserbacteria bacterium]
RNQRTSGSTAFLQVIGDADTALTASTEVNDVLFNLARTKTFSNGNITLQREFLIQAPTDTFTSFATSNFITDLATVGITGAPILSSSANGTSTNSHTLYLGASALTASTTNSYGLTVNANTGAKNNYAAEFLGGNVGIGTTTPFARLDIASSSAAASAFGQLALTDTNAGSNLKHWLFSSLGGSLFIGTTTDAYATSSPPVLTLLTSGKIGIGTTTPLGLLTVYANPSTASTFTVNNAIGSTTLGVDTVDSNTSIFSVATSTGTTYFMVNAINGYIGIGTTSPETTLTVVGAICAARDVGVQTTACGTTAGGVYANTSSLASGSDVAETYQTADQTLGSGDIVTFDPQNPLFIMRAASTSVNTLGVITTNPALMLGVTSSTTRYMALTGRVPVKVNLEGGPIAIGDRIALSDATPGVGMKAGLFDQSLGTALEPYDRAGTGSIAVYLQGAYGIDVAALERIIASSSPTSTPAYLLSNPLAAASQALKDALSAIFTALADALQGGVKELGVAVHASVGVFENLFAINVTADTVHAQTLCIDDVCVTKDQLKALLANAATTGTSGGSTSSTTTTTTTTITTSTTTDSSSSTATTSSGSSSAGTTSPDTTAPVVTLFGNNPATITVGDTYVDLGASVTDNVDQNLGYTVSVNGAPATDPSLLSLDTSTTTTYSILYSATDTSGNTGTATRTVNVVAPVATSP